MYEDLAKRLLSLSKIDAIQQEPGICRITMECIGAIKEIAIEAADAIEELSAHYCPHAIRNVHDRGDDSLCRVYGCEAKELPRWIPVTERLPEEMDRSCGGWSAEIRPSDDVLVWLSPEKRQSVAWYSHIYNDWTTADEKTMYCFGEVTHWMPLPQPPTEQTVTDNNQLIGDSEQLGEPVSNTYKLEE